MATKFDSDFMRLLQDLNCCMKFLGNDEYSSLLKSCIELIEYAVMKDPREFFAQVIQGPMTTVSIAMKQIS